MLSAFGCSVTPAENAGSAQGEVSDTDAGGSKDVVTDPAASSDKGDAGGKVTPGKLDPATGTPDAKGDGGKTEPKPAPTAGDGCAALPAVVDALKGASDQPKIDALLAKYDALTGTCDPGTPQSSPCSADLAAAQANLDEAVKSGDVGRISAAKEKYGIIAGSCSPVVVGGKGNCSADLAAAQANLDEAIKSGDVGRITAAKTKLAALIAACTPPVKDVPPLVKDVPPPVKEVPPPVKEVPPPVKDVPPPVVK